MQELVRTRAPLLLRDALQRRLQAEVVARGEERVERRLLQGDADEPADLRPVLHDVVARRRAPCLPSAAGASSERGRSSTCRPRSGRGSRRSRRARRRGRCRRPRAGPSCTRGRGPRPRSRSCPSTRFNIPTAALGAQPSGSSGRRASRRPAFPSRWYADVHRVVLAIRAGHADPQREPAPDAELALGLELAVEDERPAVDPKIAALRLRDAVHEDLEGTHDVRGKPDASSRYGSSGTFIEWQSVRRLLSVAVGLALLAAFVAPSGPRDSSRPSTPESPNADGIRDSYLFVSIFVFVDLRARRGAPDRVHRQLPAAEARPRFEDGAQVHGATKLELAWTAFPVVVLFLDRRLHLHRAAGDQGRPGRSGG